MKTKPSTDDAVQAGRDFITAIDSRALRTSGLIDLADDVAALAAAWEADGGPAVTEALREAVDQYCRWWERAGKSWGGTGNPGDIVMSGCRRDIVAAVNAAVAEHERTQAPSGQVEAAQQQVAELEAQLAAAVAALDAAVETGDLSESLRLRGPARVELPRALAAARLRLLDADLEQRQRGREASRLRVEQARAGVQEADQAIAAAEVQLRTAVETARARRRQADEMHALDQCHREPIEALTAERNQLIVAQADEQERRQRELAALTA